MARTLSLSFAPRMLFRDLKLQNTPGRKFAGKREKEREIHLSLSLSFFLTRVTSFAYFITERHRWKRFISSADLLDGVE